MARNAATFTRRSLFGAGLAGAGALALAGCSSTVGAGVLGSPLNPKQLIYWNLFGGGDGTRMQAMEAGYEKLHGGGSSLQSTTFAWGNPYYSKLTLATVGNKPPDVAISHLTRAKPLFDGNIIEPITDADLASVGLSKNDFNPKTWAAQLTDGHNIAVPLDTHPIVMFFNTAVMTKAGLLDSDGKLKNLDGMDTFEAALAAVHKVTGGPAITIANVSETATPWRVFWTFYNQIKGVTPFISNNGSTLSVDEDAFNTVTSRIQSWVKKGWLNNGLDYAGAETDVFVGKTGFYLEGEWEITTAEAVKGLKFGMVPIPTIYDTPAAQADSHTFVLPRKDRTAAERLQHMTFIKQMLQQSQTWAMGGHIPAYLPTFNSAAYKALEPQADYASAAKSAFYDDAAWYSGSGSTFENTVGAQLGLIQQMAVTPAGAMDAIKSQLKVYLNTPSPL
ncbi:sugar ABC transporter substrate-binding protein [Frondihabitans sp. PAMC 28766]|uniref:extracellular solute-binding protein n=1 Tax=Frondihabitans sp. PAMC 28766 TaxID=1795630 RepID=UPI00078D77A4|nr:extracellular solute-binding protein [Frondihabitans sp. PAMC 28766]AMM20110.1 sugar ABC transporter substrate-binding protein [Frondihabitans sp. PAMC 28766]